jgi:hypothetical protein
MFLLKGPSSTKQTPSRHVQCAQNCPVGQRSNSQLHPTVKCGEHWTVQKLEPQSQNAPDCPVSQEDKGLQRSTAPNPNSRLTWHAPDNEQCHVRCITRLSGVPIDNNDWNSGWGYKYPQPPPFKPSKLSDLHIQYKSKSIHSKTQSKDQILFKPQNQLKCLVTWERVFCVSFVALVAWIAFSFSL